MSEHLDAPPESLTALGSRLAKATAQAGTALSAQNQAAEYQRLTEQVTREAGAIGAATSILNSEYLTAEYGPDDTIAKRRGRMAAQLNAVRGILRDDPNSLRRGSTWRKTIEAIQSLLSALDEKIEENYEGLIERLPHPEPGLLDALPPEVPEAAQYQAAIARYREMSVERPSSPDDLTKLVALAQQMGELQEQLLPHAVPEHFREQWRRLQADGLPLRELDRDFQDWLEQRRLVDRVVVQYAPA